MQLFAYAPIRDDSYSEAYICLTTCAQVQKPRKHWTSDFMLRARCRTWAETIIPDRHQPVEASFWMEIKASLPSFDTVPGDTAALWLPLAYVCPSHRRRRTWCALADFWSTRSALRQFIMSTRRNVFTGPETSCNLGQIVAAGMAKTNGTCQR
ncbi:hypothetical protein BKA80DRAFT_52852 [Phyllosticta citrichinensis]